MTNGQFKSNNFILGIDIGINNQFATQVADMPYWSASGTLPVGINIQYLMSDRISIGAKANVSQVKATFQNGADYGAANIFVACFNLTGVYYYANGKHLSIGSGLSLGYLLPDAPYQGYTIIENGFKYDVVIIEANYLINNHLGFSGNLNLLDGFNYRASFGLIWRII
jgi:hypothetical protein